MKIKVSKTFQKVLALVLCTVMLFGAAPLASFIGLIPDASAEDLYTIRFFDAYEDEPYTDLKFAEGETLFTVEEDEDGNEKIVYHDKVPCAVKEGYSFKGWQPELPEKMPAEDLAVTAQWQINQYTIEFKANGGKFEDESETYTIEQDYGTAITAPAEPTKEGYTFAGWFDANGQKASIPEIMPAEDMTITAKWTVNQYTITFETDGGTEIDPITQDYGTAIPVLAEPKKEGYDFDDWDTEIPTTMPAGDMVITAKWTISNYKLTLDAIDGKFADGSTTYVKNYDYNTAITVPETPVKEGYTFAGWLDANGKGASIPERMPAADVTLRADWNANSVNVKYDPNGGYVVDKDGNITENVVEYPYTYDNEFDVKSKPADPTRTGYTFLGWFDEKGDAMAVALKPGAPLEYKAKWSEGTGGNYYKVYIYTMDEDGENYSIHSEALYAAEVGEEVAATYDIPTGYKLDETKHPDGTFPGGTVESTHTAIKPLELKVYVAREAYKITLNANGGTIATDNGSLPTVELENILYATAVTAPSNPTRAGYTFDGWKNNATGKVEAIPSVMPASDLTYTAQWKENTNTKYAVVINYADATKGGKAETKKFDFAGTTGGKVKILIDGTAADDGAIYHKLADFTLTHYKFDTTAMAKQQLEGTIAADGTTVLNLYFVPVEYTVKFEVSGHVIHDASVKYYADANTVKPSDELVNDAFKDYLPGYKFKDWEPKLSNVVADTTYKAVYTPIAYTIEFNYIKLVTNEDGEAVEIDLAFSEEEKIETMTKDFNTSVTIPDCPEKAGYSCLGWFDETGKEYDPAKSFQMPAKNLVLTAKYKANPYTITFKPSLEGLDKKEVTELCDNEVTITEDMIPSKEGYTFKGWFDYTNADKPVQYNKGDKIRVPAHDVTLVAEWSVGKFMLVFKSDDAILNDLTYKDIASDTPITAPDFPSDDDLKGRTFLGWREEGKKAGDPLFVFDKMPGRSVVLEAVWGYTLTLDPTEGKIASQPAATEIGIETDLGKFIPTRTGYSFTGWFETEDRTGNSVADKVSYPVDTTLYAGWTINSYTITFANTGDSTIAPITKNYGSDIEAPADPVKVGHTFAGWDTEIPATMPAIDNEDKTMVITAKWTVNKYTFTFLDYEAYKADGTETVISAPITQDYDTEVAAPADPVKTGYTWNSWVDEDGNEVEILEKMPAEDVTYYGVWTINQYEITFDSDGGTYVAPIGGDYGTAVEIPANPTKVGYTFAGWEDEAGNIVSVPSTIPAKNLALKAVWTINQYRITFRDSDGFVYMTTVQDYGSEIVAPANPERVGSVFMGWDIGEVPETVPARNLTFTAVWKDLDYTITFKDDDGDTLKVITGKYGTKIGEIEEPRKLFYNFKGWDKEVPETMPAEDMVITAVWERDTSFIDGLESFFMSFFAILTRIVNIFSGMLV